jgi:hypothetical protein
MRLINDKLQSYLLIESTHCKHLIGQRQQLKSRILYFNTVTQSSRKVATPLAIRRTRQLNHKRICLMKAYHSKTARINELVLKDFDAITIYRHQRQKAQLHNPMRRTFQEMTANELYFLTGLL